MAQYTCTIKALIDNNIDIFEGWTFSRRADAQAIVSDEQLKEGFIQRYLLREIGFETVERFKHYLSVMWRESMFVFDRLLLAYHEEILVKSNIGSTNKVVYQDTPMSKLGQDQHATSVTDTKGSGYAGLTEIELLDIYHDKLRDIESEFYDSFDKLFMQIF